MFSSPLASLFTVYQSYTTEELPIITLYESVLYNRISQPQFFRLISGVIKRISEWPKIEAIGLRARMKATARQSG